MRKYACLVSLLYLLGCSVFSGFSDSNQLYEIRMMSGNSLYSKSKPKLDSDGFYRFDDVNNQNYVIQQRLVLFINPVKVKK